MENLQVNQREKKTRHSSRQCRRKGLVPGVIYGKGINNFLFEIGELELNHALSVTGEHGLLNINSQEGSLNTLIKEVQRDPVTRRVLQPLWKSVWRFLRKLDIVLPEDPDRKSVV